tara:strand:- start:216 stop:485 length:270 start_codon:yes stop_codon:yes gene_type:complete
LSVKKLVIPVLKIEIPSTCREVGAGIFIGGPIITAACGIPILGTNPKKHGPLAATVPGNTFGTPGKKDVSNAPITILSPTLIIEQVCAI